MKILNKTISLIIIIAIMLNTTACSKLTEAFSSSKASASNVTTDSIINDANNNAHEIDKIESANINIEFSFMPTLNNTIKGKCQLDTFITDMKAHLSTSLTKNDSSSENNIYLDQTNLLFSLDGTSYYKYDLSTITSFAPMLNTIMNFVKNLNSTDSESDSANQQELDIQSTPSNNQESTDSNFINGTDFQRLLKIMLNIGNSLTLDGTKTIYGHEMYVLKASITNESISSLLNTSLSIPDDISSKLTSIDGIDVELYISASGENIIGFYIDLSNIVSTFFDVESSDNNYIQLLFGLNTSKVFQIPNANEIEFMDIISLISDISNSIDNNSNDSIESFINLDISKIFDNFNLNDIYSMIDIKGIVLTIIKNYVFGESESLIPTIN